MEDRNIFYVYEHWRPDTETCFWVGKGNGDRAWRKRRNSYHGNIVKKLARAGMQFEVRIVDDSLSEADAHSLEIKRIALWRQQGVRLTNITDGGEGVTGLTHSAETRAKLSEITSKNRIGVRLSEETRAKIALSNAPHYAARRGTKNPAHSEALRGRALSSEHRAKIAKGLTGRPVSDATREKIRASNIGQVRSDETKRRLSVSHLGKKQSDETQAKKSASLKLAWARRKAGLCQQS